MRKILCCILLCVIAATTALTLSGCNTEQCETHTFGEWQITRQPTCATLGENSRKCSVCGYTEVQKINKTETHTFGEWNIIAPTCGQNGRNSRICEVCGLTETELTAPTNAHEYGEWAVKTNPTCNKTGERAAVCKKCGFEKTERVPATGEHEFIWNDVKEATCISGGERMGKCNVCGFEKTEYTDKKANNHLGNYSEWEVVTEANCKTEGLRFHYCLDCSTRINEKILPDATKHVQGSVINQSAATCINEGYIRYSCALCNVKYKVIIPVDENAHEYRIDAEQTTANCFEIGNVAKKCELCKNVVLEKGYYHSEKQAFGTFDRCVTCGSIVDDEIILLNNNKYDKSIDLYFEGGFEVEYIFSNKGGLSGSFYDWHNFLFDIAPATYCNGRLVKLDSGKEPIMPLIPYYSAGYYGDEHASISRLGGSVSTTWFHDQNGAEVDFASAMARGTDVKVTIVRNDYGPVNAVMSLTTNDGQPAAECTVTATLCYEGVPRLYVAMTGEDNEATIKQIYVKKGQSCEEQIFYGYEELSVASKSISNGTTKNINGLNFDFEGDFEAEFGFDMTGNVNESWHSFIFYVFKGADADYKNNSGGDLFWSCSGNGAEPDRYGIWHQFPNEYLSLSRFSDNFNSDLANSRITLRIARREGYLSVLGTAVHKNSGVLVGNYKWISKIGDSWNNARYNGGKYEGIAKIRLTTENATAQINYVRLYSGTSL